MKILTYGQTSVREDCLLSKWIPYGNSDGYKLSLSLLLLNIFLLSKGTEGLLFTFVCDFVFESWAHFGVILPMFFDRSEIGQPLMSLPLPLFE